MYSELELRSQNWMFLFVSALLAKGVGVVFFSGDASFMEKVIAVN